MTDVWAGRRIIICILIHGGTRIYVNDLWMLISARGGKSTLIRTLIRNAALNVFDDAPIPGNHAERYRSTSGGVHLYCDPKTIDTDVPLFYAGMCKLYNSNGL